MMHFVLVCINVLRLKGSAYFCLTHLNARTKAKLFELTFSDSGHWDFALLRLFELMYRTITINTLVSVSEFSLVEKISTAPTAVAHQLQTKQFRNWGFEAVISSLRFSLWSVSAVIGTIAVLSVFVILWASTTFGFDLWR